MGEIREARHCVPHHSVSDPGHSASSWLSHNEEEAISSCMLPKTNSTGQKKYVGQTDDHCRPHSNGCAVLVLLIQALGYLPVEHAANPHGILRHKHGSFKATFHATGVGVTTEITLLEGSKLLLVQVHSTNQISLLSQSPGSTVRCEMGSSLALFGQELALYTVRIATRPSTGWLEEHRLPRR